MAKAEKKCSKCGSLKPATDEHFYMRSDKKSLSAVCKVCDRAKSRQWRKDNKGYWQEYRKKYYYTVERPNSHFTTLEERRQDGWKCLAIDTLICAVNDIASGKEEAAWLSTGWYETLCEAAGFHPEYIRRGIRETGILGEP